MVTPRRSKIRRPISAAASWSPTSSRIVAGSKPLPRAAASAPPTAASAASTRCGAHDDPVAARLLGDELVQHPDGHQPARLLGQQLRAGSARPGAMPCGAPCWSTAIRRSGAAVRSRPWMSSIGDHLVADDRRGVRPGTAPIRTRPARRAPTAHRRDDRQQATHGGHLLTRPDASPRPPRVAPERQQGDEAPRDPTLGAVRSVITGHGAVRSPRPPPARGRAG